MKSLFLLPVEKNSNFFYIFSNFLTLQLKKLLKMVLLISMLTIVREQNDFILEFLVKILFYQGHNRNCCSRLSIKFALCKSKW